MTWNVSPASSREASAAAGNAGGVGGLYSSRWLGLGIVPADKKGMIDVALCMLALVSGGVSLELFCDSCLNGRKEAAEEAVGEFEWGNPS